MYVYHFEFSKKQTVKSFTGQLLLRIRIFYLYNTTCGSIVALCICMRAIRTPQWYIYISMYPDEIRS